MNENGLLTRLDSSDGNELCCEICFVKFHSVFRIPKNFPCGHCFCEQCVTRLTSAVPPWSIKCPKCCQVGFSINAKFPSNYILCGNYLQSNHMKSTFLYRYITKNGITLEGNGTQMHRLWRVERRRQDALLCDMFQRRLRCVRHNKSKLKQFFKFWQILSLSPSLLL
jgi:hypothetical protein